MIQKIAQNEDTSETEGETDKTPIVFSDRTANLDITKETAAIKDGSESEDVEPEGVRFLPLYLSKIFDRKTTTFLFKSLY